MRFLFGRGWVLCDETNGEGDGNGTAGAAGGEGEGDGSGAVEGEGGEGAGALGGEGGDKGGAAAGAKKEDAPKDMMSAIDAGLGYKKDPDGNRLDATGKITHDKDGKPVEAKVVPVKPEAGKESDTHHANGKPKKDATGQALDADGKVVKQAPAKAKTAAELDLKPDERKALHAKTQARFGEVITTLKAHESTIAKQTETIKTLSDGRDAILGAMEESKTSKDQLAAYLHFNSLLQSTNAKDLESALEMVEDQRASLYKALGREPAGGGIDLLAEFPDLVEKVKEAQLTREDALEIANSRREKAERDTAAQRQQQQQRAQAQTSEQRKAAEEAALNDIKTWSAELATTDLDYKAKEDRLDAKVPGVIKNYAPALWLPTLKMLYEGIVIEKAQGSSGSGHRPLRPSGAKPGGKAPTTMEEAINQGLGYVAK